MDHTQNTQPGTSTPSTPTPPAGGMPADLLARLTAAGVSLDDLTQAGLVWAEETPPRSLSRQVTLALVELERDRPGSHKTWSPYLRILVDGLPDLCPCACETCSTGPCPCRSGVHANGCLPPAGEDLDCADRYAGAGSRDIDAVVRCDISDLAWWTRRKALKRTVARNLKRPGPVCRGTRPTAAGPRRPRSGAPGGCSAG